MENPVVRRWLWAFENDTTAFREVLHPEIEWFPIEENNTPSYGVDAAVQIRTNGSTLGASTNWSSWR